MLLLTKRTSPPKLTVADVKAALGEPGEGRGKPVRINFLVTREERDQIRETAAAFGLSVTRYMLQLHRVTRGMVESQKRRARRFRKEEKSR